MAVWSKKWEPPPPPPPLYKLHWCAVGKGHSYYFATIGETPGAACNLATTRAAEFFAKRAGGRQVPFVLDEFRRETILRRWVKQPKNAAEAEHAVAA